MKLPLGLVLVLTLAGPLLRPVSAAEEPFSGLNLSLGNLYRTSPAQTRSISAENPTGAKGQGGRSVDGPDKSYARELGPGWKNYPKVIIPPHATSTLADVAGPGAIQQIWMVPSPWDKLATARNLILRFYWDGETEPSVECPLGDFFASGLGGFAQINSLAVCVNPRFAFNCYWAMPFRTKAKITLENRDDTTTELFYQINYTLTRVPDDAAYFHAQFRRENPLKQKGIYTILDGVEGMGQYVGTYMIWGPKSSGWWGEGEIKFYLDGDKAFPTICGTGTEDYFGGSYDFVIKERTGDEHYLEFSTPYSGMPQVTKADGKRGYQQRFGLYRWHILDPIRFQHDFRVTIQALGAQSGKRFHLRQDDVSSVAFWYQKEPHKKFPPLPSPDDLELH